MHQILYVSSATELVNAVELHALLAEARERNRKLGVTGMLLYKSGDFMQVLEGEESVISSLYQRITIDRRHRLVTTVLNRSVKTRDFADWEMGFREMSTEDLQKHDGLTDFLKQPLLQSAKMRPSVALRVLRTFAET